MARDLQQFVPDEHMATKINILKLLQEVAGLAQFTSRAEQERPANPLLIQFRGPTRRKPAPRLKYLLKIDMQEPADIPRPVRIRHLGPTA